MFDPPENVPLKVLEWMTQIFWQADLIVGAFTGFYRRGTLILDIRKAAWQYLVTWGVFDFLLVIMGWLFIFLDLVEDAARSQVPSRFRRSQPDTDRCTPRMGKRI